MFWFDYYGLAIMIIVMIPNIVFAVRHKEGFENFYKNKAVEIMEQIGRYGCFVLMIFNIPYTYFGFWFRGAQIVYLSVNGALCLAYCIFWIICRKGRDRLRALSLSVIPSAIFLFSGVLTADIPLVAFALLFAVNHILLSCKNAAGRQEK